MVLVEDILARVGTAARLRALGAMLTARFFFFNDPATTEISTLPLPDALPIYNPSTRRFTSSDMRITPGHGLVKPSSGHLRDRKSTRLNSSHLVISYAVFC